MTLPPAEAGYLATVVSLLGDEFGNGLVGVYPTGSVALDGYVAGRSDLDVIAVVERTTPESLRAVVRGLSHEVLPCPAAGLELVL